MIVLEGEPHAVGADTESAALDERALRRIFEQHGVGVVDVRVDLVTAPEPGQTIEAAIRPRDCQVIHLVRGALADAEADQLVVGPEGSVEQHEVGVAEPVEHRRVEAATAGDEGTGGPARAVRDHEANGVPRRVSGGKLRWAGRHHEALDPEAGVAAVAIAERNPGAGRHGCDLDLRKGAGDRKYSRVGLEHLQHRRRGAELKVPGLSQQHDSNRVIELRIGEDDAFDRHVARTFGHRRWKSAQLLANVGRGVQEEPPTTVGAHRRGRLCSGDGSTRLTASHPA